MPPPTSRAATFLAVKTERRRADIQGLRALAIVLVVSYHAGIGVHGGFTGVDVFFVISGFVITSLLLRDLVAHRTIRFAHFYRRRALRLLPALGLMVAIVALLGILLAPIDALHIGALTGLASVFFAANAYLYLQGADYFVAAVAHDPFLHLWTLAVEEQFYLVFPVILLVGWRLARRRGATAVIAVVAGMSFLLSLELSRGHLFAVQHRPQQFAFYGSPTRAWEFAAGALIALAGTAPVPRPVAEAATAAGLGLVVLGAFVITSTTGFPGTAALLPVVGTALVIATGSESLLARRLLGNRPATWIGDRSYGWYLWHWPAIVYAHALWPLAGWVPAAAALAALLPAALSFTYIENPIRRRRTLKGTRVSTIAIGASVIGAIASGLMLGATHALSRTGPGADWARASVQHVDRQRGCESSAPLDASKVSACTWAVPHPHGRIVLIGDSTASAVSEAVVAAGNRAGFDVTVSTYLGCPFVALRVYGSTAPPAVCDETDRVGLRTIRALRPALVFVVNRTDHYTNGPMGLGQSGRAISYERGERLALWTSGLRSYLAALSRASIPVVVVRHARQISDAPTECAVVRVLTRTCSASAPRAAVDAEGSLRRAPPTSALHAGWPGCRPSTWKIRSVRHGAVRRSPATGSCTATPTTSPFSGPAA